MQEIDPTLPKGVMEEYLRRNLLHCSSVGAEANAKAALARLATWKSPPKWLMTSLQGIIDRCEKVAPEMAKHRDEIKVFRDKPERKIDWHYDSQGYCDNPGRGYRLCVNARRISGRLFAANRDVKPRRRRQRPSPALSNSRRNVASE